MYEWRANALAEIALITVCLVELTGFRPRPLVANDAVKPR